jgi:glycosyl hydrolase family 20
MSRIAASVTRVGAAIAVSTLIAAAATPTHAAAEPANAAPAVVPQLQQWAGGSGDFHLIAGSRIVVDSAHADTLSADARTFADDLAALGVERLPVVAATTPQPGDIFLTADSDGTGEAFRLAVTTRSITVDGAAPAGTFYGEQVVEQILGAAADHRSVPVGADDDTPAQRERGLMIDTARKYWTVRSIEQLIRELAWMRLNTLHWHVSDSEFFRLDVPGYPGLAAPQSYSPADVRAVQDYAARYHVTVLPELDIPGHSTALTAYQPQLRWDCPSMNEIINPGRIDPGFTVDITKPANVAYLDGLVGAVAGMFDSPIIHLGGDETPGTALQAQCPELSAYATARGYAKTEDVFLAYENHLDDVLAAHGKRMEIWGWWPQAGGAGSVTVNKDVRIQAWLGDESTFLAQGYDVVVSNEHSRLYVVPKYAPGTANGNYIPDDNALYSSFAVNSSPQVAGVEMAEWGDNAYTMPDAYPLYYLHRPLQVLAAVTWGSPRLASYLDYEVLADQVGAPPGMPEAVDPAARPVPSTDTPFGIDLGAPTRLAGVRLLPRSSSSADLGSLAGATVQGCTDGPDAGCRQLADVPWTPTRDWLTLPVDDAAGYRWVRVVGGGPAAPALAGLQALAVPDGGAQLTIQSPASLTGGAGSVAVQVTNTTDRALPAVRVGLAAQNVLDNAALTASPDRDVTVPPGQSRTVQFDLAATGDASPGTYRLAATADYRIAGDDPATSRRASATARTGVPLRDLAQAFDNVAITDDADPEPGDADGAGSSFSAQGLARAGVVPGGTLTADRLTFTMSERFASTVDNALAHGQTIPLTGHASRVGLLATGTYTPAPATVTVTYADGSRADAQITVPDWSAASPAATVAANGGAVNGNGRAQTSRPANLYAISIPTDPGRELAAITLPAGPAYTGAKTPAIHVFAIAQATA